MAAGLIASLVLTVAAVEGVNPLLVFGSPGHEVSCDYEAGCIVADSGTGWSYTFEYPPVEPGLEFLWTEAVADMEAVSIPFEREADSQFIDRVPECWETWFLEGGMSILPAPDGMALALCEYWVFTAGAHGLNNTLLYRFARDVGPDGTSRWVPLESRDLLADSAELVRFSEIVIDSLVVRLGPEPDRDWINAGAGPYWQNYSILIPVPDSTGALAGFTVRFAEYAVGPYCFGQQEVFVPIGALRP